MEATQNRRKWLITVVVAVCICMIVEPVNPRLLAVAPKPNRPRPRPPKPSPKAVCEFLSVIEIPPVWEGSSVVIAFNTTDVCTNFNLHKNGIKIDYVAEERTPSIPGQRSMRFTIANINMSFNGSIMDVVSVYGSVLEKSNNFSITVQGKLKAVANVFFSSNCNSTTIEFTAPFSSGLPISNFTYQLLYNNSTVHSAHSNITTITLDNSFLKPNTVNYTILINAWSPYEEGCDFIAPVFAAMAPKALISFEVVMLSKSNEAYLRVEIKPYDRLCSPELPLRATFTISHSGKQLFSKIHLIHFNENTFTVNSSVLPANKTEYLCTVVIDNLSKKNETQSSAFNTMDVQNFTSVALNDTKQLGAIKFCCEIAENSSIAGCFVDVVNSNGQVESTAQALMKNMGKICNTTQVLPNGTYQLILFYVLPNGVKEFTGIRTVVKISNTSYSESWKIYYIVGGTVLAAVLVLVIGIPLVVFCARKYNNNHGRLEINGVNGSPTSSTVTTSRPVQVQNHTELSSFSDISYNYNEANPLVQPIEQSNLEARNHFHANPTVTNTAMDSRQTGSGSQPLEETLTSKTGSDLPLIDSQPTNYGAIEASINSNYENLPTSEDDEEQIDKDDLSFYEEDKQQTSSPSSSLPPVLVTNQPTSSVPKNTTSEFVGIDQPKPKLPALT